MVSFWCGNVVEEGLRGSREAGPLNHHPAVIPSKDGTQYSVPLRFLRWQRRNSTGSQTSITTATGGSLPDTWVRLVRSGNSLIGYKSTDGTNWIKVNSRNISMAANIYVGLAVASGSSNTVNRSTFSTTSVTP